ncbi:MAG: hypothetical protein BGO51_05565 [Rhodospirillales bacterium 69-11]|nr:tetratricopeptide repeat protein [Rhodospirillales bacterium]OJW27193.1 MAG: hypothetical protein BGO51_05565 [Rhodospirillales bacterium 69-11]
MSGRADLTIPMLDGTLPPPGSEDVTTLVLAAEAARADLAVAPDDPDLHATYAAILHRLGHPAAAEPHYREALRLRPADASSWSNLGLALLATGSAAEAELCQRRALRLRPDLADAHSALGMAQYAQGCVAEAENSFRGALRLAPDHPNALLNLGTALQSLDRLDEAHAYYLAALGAGAPPAKVLNNLGLLLQEMGRLDEAEATCRAALDQDPDQAEARVNLAMVLLARGALAEGWRAYESRFALATQPGGMRRFLQPQWTGATPPDGRTILLHAEQGFGDTLQFCRYAPLVAAAGARVVLEVPPALMRLVGTLAGVVEVVMAGDPLPGFDLHCPLMSLPLAFGTTLESIPRAVPYLHPEPAQAEAWRQALGGLRGRRIGLVWAGSARLDNPHAAALDRRRSVPLETLAPLAALPDVSFVSLQLGPAATQPAPAGLHLHDPTAHLRDFADTAAVIAALDAVVSVDSAVAHLGGAMGKPVFLLNRFDTCWRWLHDRDDSPWYPTLRQFRQPAPHDWATPVGRLTEALAALRPAVPDGGPSGISVEAR